MSNHTLKFCFLTTRCICQHPKNSNIWVTDWRYESNSGCLQHCVRAKVFQDLWLARGSVLVMVFCNSNHFQKNISFMWAWPELYIQICVYMYACLCIIFHQFFRDYPLILTWICEHDHFHVNKERWWQWGGNWGFKLIFFKTYLFWISKTIKLMKNYI